VSGTTPGGRPGPGSTFGPYRVDSTIGVGGTGVVYLATDQRLGRQVALKVVLGRLADSAAFVARFEREAATLARLQSPHVVQVFDHGVEDGTPWIATQYAAGGDLGRLLARRGPLRPELGAELCAQVAEALRDAHRAGVVHRDVKPANVLLRDDRLDRVHALLCDFGVAQTDAGALTEPGATGTWTYLAPERITGDPGSPASDVYAVGCLLHEVLTGRPPYEGPDVEVALAHQDAPVPQLPGTDGFTRHANRILAGTLAKDPAQRYRSASVLRDDLRSLAGIPSHPPRASEDHAAGTPAAPAPLHDQATQARAYPPPTATPPPAQPPAPPVGSGGSGGPAGPTPPRSRRSRWLAATVAAALAVVVGVGVAVVTGDDDPEPGPGGSTDSPTPTGGPTSGAPEGPTAVRGDVDGDGYGDLAVLTFDGMDVYRSDGSALGVAERRNRPSDLTALIGDLDGDGANDVLRVEGSPPRMTASLNRAGAATTLLTTPRNDLITLAIDVPMVLADVDGDGDLDLVLLTRTSLTESQVDVALNDGTGALAPVTTWWSGPLRKGSIYAVDADDDGTDDLVHVSSMFTDDMQQAAPEAVLLRSDGEALAVEGEPTVIDNGGTAVLGVRAADVDGDGADELVGLTAFGPRANVWEWNGRFFEQDIWLDSPSGDTDVPFFSAFGATDLDGDGLDDLVLLDATRTAVGALMSDGSSLTLDTTWTARLGPDAISYSLLDTNFTNSSS
jgi:serine/threonine protein kinase